jgi:hypothetical protein
LNDPAVYGEFIKIAEDYFSLVPRELWATIDGRPIIAVYYQGSNDVAAQNDQLMQLISDRFNATHGVRPYLIADRFYDPNSTKNLPVDDFFSWGAAECSSCLSTSGGFAQRSVFEVGPGFHEGSRVKDRQNGDFYRRGWDRGIGKGNHMVLIDTFNYFVEGSAIAETRDFGRTYLDITREKALAFKASDFAAARSVSLQLGETNSSHGLMQDDVPDHTTSANAGGGRRAAGTSMFFAVDDSFVESATTRVRVTVEYLDSGVTNIDLKYDSPSGDSTTAPGGIDVRNSNSGQFRSKSWEVDAFFGNRQQFANDLRLDTETAGGMVIRSVTIEKLGESQPTPTPTPTVVPCATDSTPGVAPVPTAAAGIRRNLLPVIYRNACGV